MTDYIDKLILQTQGLQDIEALKAALDKQIGAMNAAATAAKQQAGANEQLAQSEKQVDAAQGGTAKSTRNMGFAVLEASRAIEDLQYGVAGVLNNLPGLISALGGPAGLAGILSLVAVGIFQLVRHWSELKELLTGASDKTNIWIQSLGELKKTIEELEKNPHKIGIDVERLETAKKLVEDITDALEAVEALRRARTPTEEKIAAGVREAVTLGGKEPAVEAAIAMARREEGTYYTGGRMPALNQRFIEAQEKLANVLATSELYAPGQQARREEAARREFEEARTAREEAAKLQNKLLLGGAARGGEEQRAEVERLLMAHPETFRAAGVDYAKFGAALIAASQANIEAREAETRFIQEQVKSARAEKVARDRLTATLNEQAAENEALTRARAVAAGQGAMFATPLEQAAAGEAAVARFRTRGERVRERLRAQLARAGEAEARGEEQQVGVEARRLGTLMGKPVEAGLLLGAGQGIGPATADMIMRQQVRDQLKRAGMGDEKERFAVAARIVAAARSELDQQTAGLLGQGLSVQMAMLQEWRKLGAQLDGMRRSQAQIARAVRAEQAQANARLGVAP